METKFKKPREVFVQNGLKNKNLFHIFHRCHQLGESKPSFSLIFQIFSFSVSVLILRELFRRFWRRNWRNRRRFLSRTCSYKITSFSFYTGVTIEEKQRSELTPFFQQFDQFFMADSSRFLGICCYFWPRWLNSTS
jgi:hypothetical protein